MPTVLITGCGQGIGLEFARQYSADGWEVYALTRRPVSEALAGSLPRSVTWIVADITDRSALDAATQRLAGRPLDVLVNNAGRHGPRDFGRLDADEWLRVIRVNTVGSLMVTETFLPAIRAAQGKIAFMSSRGGSIAERGKRPYHQRGGSYAYRLSKAALNAAAASLAFDLQPDGIQVLVLHPGFITTETSAEPGTDDIGRNVSLMRGLIRDTPFSGLARFLAFDGEEIPW